MADNGSIPSCRRIAEVGLINIVVRHGEKAHVDLPFLASADTIHCRLHVVIDTAPRHAAKGPERVPAGVKQHLMGLQWVSPKQKGTAVRQLDMRHLQLGAFTAKTGKVLAPVELEGLAGVKMQRHKDPAPRRVLFALAICFPNRRENDPPDRFLARLIRAKAATRA